MKEIIRVPLITILFICATVILNSCEKDPVPPTVTTTGVSAITLTTASSGGNVTGDGGAAVTTRGVCWSTVQNPTTADSKTSNGTGTGSFTSSLSQLTPGTQYYVRAYATNEAGTAYGNQQSFTTNAVLLATVTTADISSYTESTAISGGNITDDGGGEVTVRGVCWSSTSQTPTTADSKTEDGSGTGSFTSNLTNLEPETTYYVRAYATNSAGTAYGDNVSFTTLALGQVLDADGNIYNTVTIGSQVWMVENLRTTKLNDGTYISHVGTGWSSLETPAYDWYDNDSATYAVPYGALYNWYAAAADNLCPVGWHVPDDNDFTALVDFLGGLSIAGGKLKEAGTAHWESPNTDATDDYGFAALPGGYRYLGSFIGLGQEGDYWSSSEWVSNPDFGKSRILSHDNASATNGSARKYHGYSVRCLKD